MKIGIYTQPLRYNYGGLLQAWALQTVLRRLGHDVVTFNPDQYKHIVWTRKPLVYAKRIALRLLGNPIEIRKEVRENREHDLKMQYLKPFIDSNIKTKTFRYTKELSSKDYDTLIVGSDQVWRPIYNRSFGTTIGNAFLDFATEWKVRRIAYAASFGTDEWEFSEKQTQYCKQLAKKFDAISVREESGIDLCRNHLGVQAVHVLDPTLLLLRDDYEKLIATGQATQMPEGDMLCYILDETDEKNLFINSIAEEKGLVPFRAHSRVFSKTASLNEMIQPPVEQWLRNFKESKFVITDSFHACLFSIIFRKPFVVIGNKERGLARYKSLFKMLSLEKHYLYSLQDFKNKDSYEITEETENKLNVLRNSSFKFLTEALK